MKEKYILYLYSASAFRQIILPAVNNADYVVRLPAGRFQFREDVCLQLEVIEQIWYLDWEEEKRRLCDNDFLKLRTAAGGILTMITQVEPSAFGAGSKYELPAAKPVTIGSTADNTICFNGFQLISALHAVIEAAPEGYYLTDKSKNGIYINGLRVSGRQRLSFGDCIDLFGLRMVFLGEALAIFHRRGREGEGVYLPPYDRRDEPFRCIDSAQEVFFHRSPRKWQEVEKCEIELEAPAVKRESAAPPLLTTLGPGLTVMLPLLFAAVIGSRSGNATVTAAGDRGFFLLMSLGMSAMTAFLGLLWGLVNWLARKKEGEWEEKRRKIVYKNYLRDAEEYIAAQYQKERAVLLERYPALPETSGWAQTSGLLWNRNPGHGDFLCQRAGLGEEAFSMVIKVPKLTMALFRDDLRDGPENIRKAYEILKEVPVRIDLEKHRRIGISGGESKENGLRVAVNLLLQIAFNNCYTDVGVAFFYNEDNAAMREAAGIIKWLPHIWAGNRKLRYLAGNRTEAAVVLQALREIFRSPLKRHYVLFIEDQQIVAEEGAWSYISSGIGELRLTCIFITAGMEEMPNDCRIFLRHDEYFQGISGIGIEQALRFDQVSWPEADRLARKLAGIRVKDNMTDGEIPDYVPFLSLFSAGHPEDLDIPGRWRKSRIHETIRVPIGRKAGGRLLYLDIHEKAHGPHGLIAGTTGSGKSEALQTCLLSLCLHFGPADAAFFIIDYKGGGMGDFFSELPHTAGIISNLSGNLVRRALISIKSENEKRQRLLQSCGMNHINQYTAAYKERKLETAMPHLFIIVDEFAELKREEPEFMKELVSVAQVGRSLGIHLILATQKPAGVVDERIFSNSRFRLCLRVQDRQDSMDMLHKPDAARLTGAGRCYLQVGSDEVFELFQTAYGGAVYDEKEDETRRSSRLIDRTGQAISADSMKREGVRSSGRVTQAEKVREILRQLGRSEEYAAGSRMWLPPLPEFLDLAQIESERKEIGPGDGPYGGGGPSVRLTAAAGLCDHPGKQEQYPLAFELCSQGHMLILGGPASGKSTLLQTLLYTMMTGHSPREVEFYLIDLSSQMLRAFRDMPHTAGMAGEEEDKWERIFYRLKQELKKRKEWFVGGSFIHMRNRKAAERLPAVILAIDNYGGFLAGSGDKYGELMLRLAAEGKNNGIYLLLTASGIGMGEISGKLAGNFNLRLCLEMGDPYQYGEILRVNRLNIYPEAGKRGRGLVKEQEEVLEFQAALVCGEGNDFIRMKKIEQEAGALRKKYAPDEADRMPDIPEIPDFASFYRLAAGKSEPGNRQIPIGYEKESGDVFSIQLKDLYCFLITGRKGSGKTNLLKIIARFAAGSETVIIDFGGKISGEALPCVDGDKGPACGRRIETDEQLYRWLKELSQLMKEHNRLMIFVLIDDLADFLKHLHQPVCDMEPMEEFVEHIWKKGGALGLYWFGASQTEQEGELLGFTGYHIFAGYGRGLHLGGNTAMQRNFQFDDLPYGEQNKAAKPGMAFIPPDFGSGTRRVILPYVEEDRE